MTTNTHLLSRKEAADILGIHTNTLDKFTTSGELRAIRIGGSTRITLEDLQSFILTREQVRVEAAKAEVGLS